MPIANPHNNYVPFPGDRVRIIGGCHPRSLNKVVEVTQVYWQDEQWWYEERHFYKGEIVYSGGLLGGLEPAYDCPIDDF